MSFESTPGFGPEASVLFPGRRALSGSALQRLALLATLCIFGIAFGLAATTMGRDNFWIDELSSLYFSDPGKPFRTLALTIWPTESNPPLYYLYLYLWRLLVPQVDEISIRAASLIPAALACLSPLVYPSRLMAYDRRIAVTLLLSCSYGMLYYATEARGYSLLLLFSVNATFLFLAAMQSLRSGIGNLRVRLALLGLVLVFAAWTHFFGILLAASYLGVLLLAALILRRHVMLVGAIALVTGAVAVLWPVDAARLSPRDRDRLLVRRVLVELRRRRGEEPGVHALRLQMVGHSHYRPDRVVPDRDGRPPYLQQGAPHSGARGIRADFCRALALRAAVLLEILSGAHAGDLHHCRRGDRRGGGSVPPSADERSISGSFSASPSRSPLRGPYSSAATARTGAGRRWR